MLNNYIGVYGHVVYFQALSGLKVGTSGLNWRQYSHLCVNAIFDVDRNYSQ